MIQLTPEFRFVNVVHQPHLGRTILEGVTHRDSGITLEHPVPHGELVEVDIKQRVNDRHGLRLSRSGATVSAWKSGDRYGPISGRQALPSGASHTGRSGQLAIGVVDRTRCIPASAKRWKAASACSVKSTMPGTTTGEVQSSRR